MLHKCILLVWTVQHNARELACFLTLGRSTTRGEAVAEAEGEGEAEGRHWWHLGWSLCYGWSQTPPTVTPTATAASTTTLCLRRGYGEVSDWYFTQVWHVLFKWCRLLFAHVSLSQYLQWRNDCPYGLFFRCFCSDLLEWWWVCWHSLLLCFLFFVVEGLVQQKTKMYLNWLAES